MNPPVDPQQMTVRGWLLSFGLIFAVIAVWALATPLYGSVDEPAHVRKAAALVRGEFTGTRVPNDPSPGSRTFELPAFFGEGEPNCFFGQSQIPASCQEFEAVKGEAELFSPAAIYPPAYYVPVGLPSLVWPNQFGLYMMRLVSGALSAACLATALLLLGRLGIRRLTTTIGMLAISPMVLYMAATVNPNGLEISAGLLTVVSGLALAQDERGARSPLLVVFAASAVILVSTRQISALWLLVNVGLVVLATSWKTAVAILRSRRGAVTAAIVGAAVLAQYLYLRSVNFSSVIDQSAVDLPSGDVLRRSTEKAWGLLFEMVGNFGWLDAAPGKLTYVLYFFALGLVILLGAAFGSRRVRAALLLAIGLTVVLPIALEYREADKFGYYWQGRYTLPIAVAVPVIGAVALGRNRIAIELDRSALRAWLAGAFVLAHLVALYYNLRRYMVGSTGDLNVITGSTAWSPPVPAWLLLVIASAAYTGLALWAIAGGGSPVLTLPADPTEGDQLAVSSARWDVRDEESGDPPRGEAHGDYAPSEPAQ